MVYVLNQARQPLMPTSDHRLVRLLLKENKAKVVRRTPFTIQLLHNTHNYKQPITLGVDAGSKTVGLSAVTLKKEIFTAELKPRNDVVGLLSARRAFRRARRSRTTRYRAPRFSNRIKSKHKGWLAPSVEVKIHNHVQGIKLACELLPVTEIVVETAEFDLQRLKAMESGKPLPIGAEYQMGEMYDHYNVRQYVLHRDGYRCRKCGADKAKFNVHHLETRRLGGDAPNNLITLCEKCHDLLHDGLMTLDGIKRGKVYRDAAFMGIMRKSLIARLKGKFPDKKIRETKGFITKYIREKAHIPKSHTNDALCITGNIVADRLDCKYLIKPVRSHNRQIHKATINKGGTRKLNQSPKYVKGYQLFDRVRMPDGREGFVFGRRVTGSFDIRTLAGEKLSASITHKKLIPFEKRKNLLIERSAAVSSQG